LEGGSRSFSVWSALYIQNPELLSESNTIVACCS
jgi:hypothetical protein